MTIYELNNVLTNLAISNYLVNDAFVGDVYTVNGKENKFACFVATPMTAVKESVGLIRYNYVLYYIDRLTKAEDNIDFVQSDAVSVLSGILNYIEEQGLQIESGYEFTLFRQKFSDWCAGAYVSVNVYVPYNDCGEDEFNLSGLGLTELVTDRNGTFVPDGYDGFGQVTVNVPVNGATEGWVDDEIDLKLQGYATEEWVNQQGFITQHQDLSSYATVNYVDGEIADLRSELPDLTDYASKNWVNNQGFLKNYNLTGYATQAWVNNQGFLKDDDLDGLVSQTWVENQGYITGDDIDDMATKNWVNSLGYITSSALTGYATRSWVGLQGYLIEDDLCDYATKEWVNQQGFLVEDNLCGLATEEWVRSWVDAQDYVQRCELEPYATKNWVENQGYLVEDDLAPYATKTWVNQQNFATQTWVSDNFIDTTEIQNYATIDYVSSNYVNNITIQDYATKNWVTNNFVDNTTIQNYVTIDDLEQDVSDLGFATEQWVENKHYLTSSDISGKLDSDSIWSGTEDEWDELTPEQQCSYLIALIVE